VSEYSRLHFVVLLKTCLDITMGIFKYILDMSGEANLKVGSIGISSKACVNCVVLFLLNVCVCVCVVGELDG